MAALAKPKLSYEESLTVIFRERLLAFYKKYEPPKVSEVDNLLTKYKGKEDALFKALVKKYGPEPTGSDEEDDEDDGDDDDDEEESEEEGSKVEAPPKPAAKAKAAAAKPKEKPANAPAPPPVAKALTFEERLVVFYEKYDPSKLDGLQKIMKKYAGAEEQLFGLLTTKYGPEPKAVDTSAAAAAEDDDAEEEEKEDEDEEDEESSEDEDSAGNVVQPNVAPGRGKGGDRADDNDEAAPESGDSVQGVVYCGVCGMPPEYCEWSGAEPAACKAWLDENHPDFFSDDEDDDEGLAGAAEDLSLEGSKKKSKRGGKGKAQQKKAVVDPSKQKVLVTFVLKGKKHITHVLGVDTFTLKNDMKLKDASKALGKRFAGASSIKDTPSGEKEIQIQGDWRYDIEDALENLLGIPRKKITVDVSTGFKKVKEPKEIAAQPDRGAPP